MNLRDATSSEMVPLSVTVPLVATSKVRSAFSSRGEESVKIPSHKGLVCKRTELVRRGLDGLMERITPLE